ncbi:MAG: hypothetical protein M3Y58_19100, partial [Chloroflexota bacterium]|nr:hypothetical protein [Chloroflexota bacterium]
AFALLARAGDAQRTVGAGGQAAGGGEGGPGSEPVVHILKGEPSEDAQQGDQQEGFLSVDARSAAGASGQRGRAATMGEAHGEAAEIEQMQGSDEGERTAMQGARLFLQRALV